MPTYTNSLPHPTTVITNIFFSLSNPPHAPDQEATNLAQRDLTSTKPALLTLHALFPTFLLPALDLLDRRLIICLELAESQHKDETSTTNLAGDSTNGSNIANVTSSLQQKDVGETKLPEHETRIGAAPAVDAETEAAPIAVTHVYGDADPSSIHRRTPTRKRVYYVRSSHSSSSLSARYSRTHGGPRAGPHHYGIGEKSYEVRTRAWSCTCAAFAFAAFNHEFGRGVAAAGGEEDEGWGGGGGGYDNDYDDDYDDEGRVEGEDGIGIKGEGDSYGGKGRADWGGLMALYGTGRQGCGEGSPPLPMCKHLLACMLVEWWGEAREMVELKEVGREEFAGWAAGWGG